MSDLTIRPTDGIKPIIRPAVTPKPSDAPPAPAPAPTPQILQDAFAFTQQATRGSSLPDLVAATKTQLPVFQGINSGLPGGGDSKSTKMLTEPLFSGGAGASQVEQGWIGDCEIVSAVTAIAARNPNFFKSRISETGGQVTVKTGKWTQTVDRQVYWDTTKGRSCSQNGGDRGSGTAWFPMLEKAMAFRAGGYDKLDNQNDIAYVFDLFAGGMKTFNLNEKNFNTLLASFNSGHAVTALHDNAGTAVGLFPGHGYAVIDMTKDTVTLQNPYGPRALLAGADSEPAATGIDNKGSKTDGVFSMSRADFLKYFAAASYSVDAVV